MITKETIKSMLAIVEKELLASIGECNIRAIVIEPSLLPYFLRADESIYLEEKNMRIRNIGKGTVNLEITVYSK
jgi:hypothetical protein